MARKRIVLNRNLACEIQSLAPSFADRMRRGFKSRLSSALAIRFGVNAKTIRDIWNSRSWTDYTECCEPITHQKADSDCKECCESMQPTDPFLSADTLASNSSETDAWEQHFCWQGLFE